MVAVFLVILGGPERAHARTGASAYRGRPMGRGPFGVGVQVGAPLGITAKWWFSGTFSADIAVGAGFGADPHVHADLIWEAGELYRGRDYLMRLYLGGGARVEIEDRNDGLGNEPPPAEDEKKESDLDVGPRALVGLEHRFRQIPPLELFIEVGVGYDVVPETGPTVDGAIGARWYF